MSIDPTLKLGLKISWCGDDMTHVVFLVHTFHQQQHEVCQTLDRLMCWVSIQAGHTIDSGDGRECRKTKIFSIFKHTLGHVCASYL